MSAHVYPVLLFYITYHVRFAGSQNAQGSENSVEVASLEVGGTQGVYYLKNGRQLKPKAAEYPPFRGCYDGDYMPDSKKRVPTYKVNLDLPPERRWVEVTSNKKAEIISLVNSIKKHTELIFGVTLTHLVDRYMPLLFLSLPRPYYDELLGVAEISELPIGEVTLFNLFYEFFSVCTSIVMEDEDGEMYHGRNMDFGLFLGWDSQNQTWLTTEFLRPLIVNVDFQRNNKTLFTSTTFAGYVGVLTALKKDAFSLTVNERFTLNGGYIGLAEWVLGRHRQQWIGLLTRSVMENADSYKQAEQMLISPSLIAPVYFILSGAKRHQGVIITRGRSDVNILNIGANGTRDFASWFLVQTNYDHWKSPPFFDDRRGPSVTCLNKWGQENPRKTLYNVLSTRPVLNKLTVYTTIMNVRDGTFDTQLQDCKSPCWPW